MSHVEIIKQKDLSVYLMETGCLEAPDVLDSLTESELKRYASIGHEEKRKEFAASRHLRTLIFGKQQIMYTEIGAPFLPEEGFISVSHTIDLVGIACSHTFKVGMDLECVREKAARLASRFVNESEKRFFDTGSPFDMSLLWSLKETLYKLAGRKGILFAEELLVERTENGFCGTISQPDGTWRYELMMHMFGDKLVTCNTSDVIRHA
jgi:4'-phosphopantetheinyl transferase